MRTAMPIGALGLLALALAGCNSTRWSWLHTDKDTKAPTPTTNVTVASIVDYLNNYANRVNSLRVDHLNITINQGIQRWDVPATLMTEKPRNFRMKARVGIVGGDVADLGSNHEEFWFWGAKQQPPYLFYCAHSELAQVRSLPMPFQPDWIMEALGLGPYGPAERYQPLEVQGDSYHLVEKTRSPQGVPVRKVIVMNRFEARGNQPQVTAFLLLDDATGKEICSAHITEVREDPTTRARLPRRIELRWPAEKLALNLLLDGVSVNAALPQTAFVRPRLTGVDSYNLARGRLDSGLQPAQGLAPSASR